jgi:hypothetical protein
VRDLNIRSIPAHDEKKLGDIEKLKKFVKNNPLQ